MNKLATKIQTEMKTLRFGIEIETVGLTRESVANAIQTVVGGNVNYYGGGYDKWQVVAADGRIWTSLKDGSVTGSYENRGGEITSPILTYADLETVQSIVRTVRTAGARVDASCGVHVHVDGSRMTAKSLRSLALLVHNREVYIEGAVGVAPARKAQYCRSINDGGFITRLLASRKSTEALRKAWYGEYTYANAAQDHYHSSRYHGLNLHSFFFRGTVEFRYFNGSLHAGEVKAYVQFCLALAARSLCSGSVGKRQELATNSYAPRAAMYWTLTAQLGLVGDEFKTVREHLTKNLSNEREEEVANAAA
jgi:hypothetical protein